MANIDQFHNVGCRKRRVIERLAATFYTEIMSTLCQKVCQSNR